LEKTVIWSWKKEKMEVTPTVGEYCCRFFEFAKAIQWKKGALHLGALE
jgi:hypothetical protein